MGGQAGQIEPGRSQVLVDDKLVHDLAFREKLGIAGNERDADPFFVECSFITKATFSEEISVITGVNNHRIIREFQFGKRVQQASEIFIDSLDVAKIVEVDGVIDEAAPLAFFGMGERLVIDGGDGAVGSFLRFFPRIKSAQSFGQTFSPAFVVRAFETENQGKWFFRVLFQPLDGHLGGDIIDPAFGRRESAVDFHGAVHVLSLADKTGRVEKAWALAFLRAHVPFAKIGGLVASIAQQTGVRDGIHGKRRVIVHDAIFVSVLAREESCTTRRADRVGDEGIAKTHALGGEAVHVGCFEPWVASLVAVFLLHDTHRIPALVISDHKNEIRLALGGVGEGSQEHDARQQKPCRMEGWETRGLVHSDAPI